MPSIYALWFHSDCIWNYSVFFSGKRGDCECFCSKRFHCNSLTWLHAKFYFILLHLWWMKSVTFSNLNLTVIRHVNAAHIFCVNSKAISTWFQTHYEDCKYLSIACPRKCGIEFEKRFLEKHLRDDCQKRDMTCEFCKEIIAADEEMTHLNHCARFPVPCPNGCKKKEIPREEVCDRTVW